MVYVVYFDNDNIIRLNFYSEFYKRHNTLANNTLKTNMMKQGKIYH